MIWALMGLSAGLARAGAGGLNLGWDECGGQPASQDRAFLCNTSSGSNTLVASFVAPCCLTKVTRIDFVLDLQSASDGFPDWWAFAPGSCRYSSLTMDLFASGPFTCSDYWTGRLPSIGVWPYEVFKNRMRIKRGIAIFPDYAGPIPEGTETYLLKYVIDNARTTGSGSCEGCATGICIVLNSANVMQAAGTPGGDKFISAPASRSWATWQGGIGSNCYQATPARNATWGSIKTLYR